MSSTTMPGPRRTLATTVRGASAAAAVSVGAAALALVGAGPASAAAGGTFTGFGTSSSQSMATFLAEQHAVSQASSFGWSDCHGTSTVRQAFPGSIWYEARANLTCFTPPAPARPVDEPAFGYVDVVSATHVSGWCKDPDTGDDVTEVHLYVDGTEGAIAGQVCNGARTDSVDGHGFDFPVSLQPGQRVTVYAIGKDAAGGVTAANPALPSSGTPLVVP